MVRGKWLIVAVLAVGWPAAARGAQERLDFWDEALSLFNCGRATDVGKASGSGAFALDYTDKREGDFSVRYDAAQAHDAEAVWFTPGPWVTSWPLSKDWSLVLQIKTAQAAGQENWSVELVDQASRRTKSRALKIPAEGQWTRLELPLKKFKAEKDFDWGGVTAVVIVTGKHQKLQIWFDGVRFVNSDFALILGVTDKPLKQRLMESRASRAERLQRMAEKVTARRGGFFGRAFSQLYLNQDTEAVNEEMVKALTSDDPQVRRKYGLHDHWSLRLTRYMCHLYYRFGSQSKDAQCRGRLSAPAERALLEELWDRQVKKNDIHWARMSTWWLTGSENHDMVAKSGNLITSQIFMHEPAFAQRVYPDLGRGPGSGYWFHQMYADAEYTGPEGRANLKDGKDYRAAEHYEAWRTFFMAYFAERARKGFFLEVASPGYMHVTLSHINDIYDFCEDQALRRQARKFLDLVWAQWSQEQISGVRGGARTRHRLNRPQDAMYNMARFLLGGSSHNDLPLMLSDYELPPILWSMALDREAMGDYAFISRKPGEEENVWPRPLGLERTLMCDTESRLVHYSWVTPDYIIGTQMDHPAAVHSHLSCQSRWHGIIFSADEGSRVFPACLDLSKPDKWKIVQKTARMYRSVQHENVLITQQARKWFEINPEWYPSKVRDSFEYGVFFSNSLDRIAEKDGWIFVQEGNGYLAIRPILGEHTLDEGGTIKRKASEGLYGRLLEDSYEWNADRSMIRLIDRFSPIIFETAQRADYATLEDFQKDILDNPIRLHKTVVVGWYVLTYQGCGPEAPQIYYNAANNEIPQIAGKYVDYAPEHVFDSPYLKSKYGSGLVTIEKGPRKLVLDFNE